MQVDAIPSVPRSLSSRMARWGLVIVGCYVLVALLTPLLIHLGVLPEANTGLANPIYDGPSWQHWCGTDRLGRDVCVRTMAGSGVALQVVLLAVGSGHSDRCALGNDQRLSRWCCRSTLGAVDGHSVHPSRSSAFGCFGLFAGEGHSQRRRRIVCGLCAAIFPGGP